MYISRTFYIPGKIFLELTQYSYKEEPRFYYRFFMPILNIWVMIRESSVLTIIKLLELNVSVVSNLT